MVLLIKTILGISCQLGFFAALMFLPIGTVDWPAAQIWLLIFATAVVLSAGFLIAVRPAALEARMRAGREAQAPADRLALGLMVLALLLPIILAALDVFSWQYLPPPTPAMKALGMAIFLFGFAVVFLSMLENEYAAPTVHIQDYAGHKLADGGIYRHIRHPMYFGFLLFTVGTTLWLGSILATLFAAVAFSASAVYRIGVEEATLTKDLPGYQDYTQRVPTRFLPFIY